MRALFACSLLVVTTLTTTTNAQLPRTRSAEQSGAPAANGIPRDPRFPYAGLWRGVRTMPLGSDDIALRFTVVDGKYAGVMLTRAPSSDVPRR